MTLISVNKNLHGELQKYNKKYFHLPIGYFVLIQRQSFNTRSMKY